jgi:hypothetical protein
MTRARETSENARQAKAWVATQINSGTPSVLNSFNVSSITDLPGTSVGHFDVNFETSMSNSNYIAVATPSDLDYVGLTNAVSLIFRRVNSNTNKATIVLSRYTNEGVDVPFCAVFYE